MKQKRDKIEQKSLKNKDLRNKPYFKDLFEISLVSFRKCLLENVS